MTDPAEHGPPAREARTVADQSWFEQIKFDPKKGLNKVLPLARPRDVPGSDGQAGKG